MTNTEEKVELTEQTPLTTTPGVTETEAGQPEAAKKEKKWWFKKVSFLSAPPKCQFN